MYFYLKDGAIMPHKNEGDIGWDIHCNSDVMLPPRQLTRVSTGLFSVLSHGLSAIIKDRSGVSTKKLLHIFAGVIDNSYRGEWEVAMYNFNDFAIHFKKGDKIAQFILVDEEWDTAEELTWEQFQKYTTARGDKGFGSTDDKTQLKSNVTERVEWTAKEIGSLSH